MKTNSYELVFLCYNLLRMGRGYMKKKDFLLLIFILIIVGANYFNINIFSYISEEVLYQVVSLEKTETVDIKPVKTSSKLKVYYLDVEEAEAILIQNLDEYMLIDAGNNNDGKKIVSFLKELNVTEELKEKNQLKWVGLMNNIKHSAVEIAMKNIIESD